MLILGGDLQIELYEEVREAELLLQAKVKERDILKSFKVGFFHSLLLSII